MKKINCLIGLALAFATLSSCGEKKETQTAAQQNTAVTPEQKTVETPKEYKMEAMKMAPIDTLFVDLYANGNVKIGKTAVDFDSLSQKLTDSLKIIQKRTGKLPNAIKARSNGQVLMGVRGAASDAIQEAKDNTGFPKQ